MKRKTEDVDELMEIVYSELRYGEFKDRYATITEIRELLKKKEQSYNRDLILKIILIFLNRKIVEVKRQIMWENSYIYTYIRYNRNLNKNLVLTNYRGTDKIRIVE